MTLAARIAKARLLIDATEGHSDVDNHNINEAGAILEGIEDELASSRVERFREFAQHKDDCSALEGRGFPCDCGLADALAGSAPVGDVLEPRDTIFFAGIEHYADLRFRLGAGNWTYEERQELGRQADEARAGLKAMCAAAFPPKKRSFDDALVGYIDGLFVSGNEVPVDRPWLSAGTWEVVKDYLRHGLPLDHDRIEIERIYRQKTAAGIRAYSPLAAALAGAPSEVKMP